jgi:hypothetical protein
LFANGTPNHRFWTNPWSSWLSLGGTGVGDPAVIDRSPGTVDTFVGGTDGALWHLPVPAG